VRLARPLGIMGKSTRVVRLLSSSRSPYVPPLPQVVGAPLQTREQPEQLEDLHVPAPYRSQSESEAQWILQLLLHDGQLAKQVMTGPHFELELQLFIHRSPRGSQVLLPSLSPQPASKEMIARSRSLDIFFLLRGV